MAIATNTTTHEIVCDECGTHTRENPPGQTGETHCPECGLILEEYHIQHSEPWRYYSEDNSDPRHAHPGDANRHDKGLGSTIGSHHEREGTRITRLHNLNEKGSSKKDRNRAYATTEISRIGTSMGYTNTVIDHAKHLFRRLHHEGVADGRDLDTLTASCVYASSRIHGTGRVPSEIAEVARCSEREISRRVWLVAQELGLEIPPPNLEARLRVVAHELNLGESTIRDSIEDLRGMDETMLFNGKPSGVVAAILYRNTRLAQERVGGACGVSEVTVRTTRDKLYS